MIPGIEVEDEELERLLQHFTLPERQFLPTNTKKAKVLVLAGPTAVGKSALAIQIARLVGGQVVSADSMQVYRGMDIGTAKPSMAEREEIPHHLIDIRDVSQKFHVAEFYEEATSAIRRIIDEGAVPIVAGGTGFYLHALLYGPPSGPASDPAVRRAIEAEMDEKGPLPLFERLKEKDPLYASSITRSDRHKIVRALEIMQLSGKRVSDFSASAGGCADKYNFRCWFLHLPKEQLYSRIEARCDKMIDAGLIEEVERLKEQGLEQNETASQAIGYRQVLDYLASSQDEEAHRHLVREFKQASRRYAKRQFTWFRKEPLFRWLDLSRFQLELATELILQDLELS